MIIYLGDNKSKNSKIAIKHIRKYLRQLESALKSGEVDIKEFEINNHYDEMGNDSINREYSPTGRRTLKIIYYDIKLGKEKGVKMFKRVKIEEIKDIKNRLELELKDKYSPLPERKKEIESLINHLNVWLDWRDDQERKHYRKVIQSES